MQIYTNMQTDRLIWEKIWFYFIYKIFKFLPFYWMKDSKHMILAKYIKI